MGYRELVELIPTEKRDKAADKLVDIVLSSKNDDKMPRDLANTILYQWQQNFLSGERGLSALLEAAVTLEHEKTLAALEQLQLNEIAAKIRGEA